MYHVFTFLPMPGSVSPPSHSPARPATSGIRFLTSEAPQSSPPTGSPPAARHIALQHHQTHRLIDQQTMRSIACPTEQLVRGTPPSTCKGVPVAVMPPVSRLQQRKVQAHAAADAPAAVDQANGSSNGHHAAAPAAAAVAVSPGVARIRETVDYIRSRCALQPQVVMVLGSGLGPIADEVAGATVIPYGDIPHFHAPGVQGHPGRLLIGHFSGVPALVLQGRFHYYEGHPMEEVIFPIRVARLLGCSAAILTNAAGGINHDFHLGDLMLITDHLNLMTANPLRGPNPPELGGPRFLDLSEPYDRSFVALLQQQAAEQGISDSLRTGTYAAVSGPTYETPAETRMLRAIGADAVGMSTVPEVIAARHVGMAVTGISCITNLACGISHDGQVAKVSHEEVMENISLGMEKMKQLLLATVPLMMQQQQQRQQAAATQ